MNNTLKHTYVNFYPNDLLFTFGSLTVRFWVVFWYCAVLWNPCISSTPWGTPTPFRIFAITIIGLEIHFKRNTIRFCRATLTSDISWIPPSISTSISLDSLSFAVQQFSVFTHNSWSLKYCKVNWTMKIRQGFFFNWHVTWSALILVCNRFLS